jgi:O-antigen ligase
MLFCIIFVDSTIQKESKYLEGFLYAIVFYLWFWATTKTNIYVTLIIIVFFLIIYILQLHKNTLDQEKNKDYISQISTSQNILALIAFIITILGFIHYYLLKSDEYKDKWNSKDFLIGVKECKYNSNFNEIMPNILIK